MRRVGNFVFFPLVFFALPALWAGGGKAAGPDPAADPVTSRLLVYSVINENATKALTELFTQKTGVRVDFFRAATGELVNRV
ncbi:MAG: hypothetical protein LBH26_03070, partial [Treponema sp.]|nr:hypothetical protein [Treponema sp.]